MARWKPCRSEAGSRVRGLIRWPVKPDLGGSHGEVRLGTGYTDTDLATVSWYARKNCLYSSLLASVISLHIRFMFLDTVQGARCRC